MVEISNEELGKAGLPAAEQGSAAPVPDELAAIPDEDFALFQATAQPPRKTFGQPAGGLPRGGMPGMRQFPLAEPAYNAKRPLDLTAFAAALDGWTPDQAAALDELLAGQGHSRHPTTDGRGPALRR